MNSGLKKLDISSTELSPSALIAFATVMQSNTSLANLNISNNMNNSHCLTQSLQNDIMLHMGKMIKLSKPLTNLSLNRLGITDWSMTDFIAPALKLNTMISHLDLSCNKISRNGGVSLIEALTNNVTLKVLNLNYCSIQDEGTIAMSEMLEKNAHLQELYLKNNKISEKGLMALAECFIINNSLKILSLWGNSWNSESCAKFAPLVGGYVRTLSSNVNENDLLIGADGINPNYWGGQMRIKQVVPECRFNPAKVDFCFYFVEGIGPQIANRE